MFRYVVETERRFYLANDVNVERQARRRQAYRRGRAARRVGVGHVPPGPVRHHVRVLTFKDVNVEELPTKDL